MIDPGLWFLKEAQFYTHLSIYHYTKSSHMQVAQITWSQQSLILCSYWVGAVVAGSLLGVELSCMMFAGF